MKRIAIYTSVLAALGSAACSHYEDICAPETRGSELVVRAELVSTSDWVTTRSESESVWGTAAESTDGEYLITAEKQEWTGAADTLAADTPVTRGTPIMSAAGIANLRVNVFKTGSSNWSTSSTLTTAINATNSGGSFTTSPGYNWPTDATSRTTLFAYSPLPTSDNGLTESASNKIAYTVPSDVTKQPDLCVAPPSMNIVNSDGVQQVRTFALSHQLTAVGFTMLGWNLKVTQVTVSGVAVSGTLTVNTSGGAHTWATSTTGSRNVGVTGNSYQHNVNNSYADITTSNGYLMMIPQTLTDAATVTITYASTGTGSTGGMITAKLKDLGLTWNAGDKITYNIRLKTAPAVTSGDLTIDTGAAGYTTSSPLSFLMDNKDNLTFTWDASWLKIHRGTPKAGDTSGGASSGWTTGTGGPWGNIYFFASNNNPSTIADRTATVTVSGTRSGTRTFIVKQVKHLAFTLDKTSPGETIPASGKSYTFTVISNTSWKVSSFSNCTISASSGTGNQNITITVPASTDVKNKRSVSVAFVTTDGSQSATWAGTQEVGIDNSIISRNILAKEGWPADKLPATGLQVAMRGYRVLPGGVVGTDPTMLWGSSTHYVGGTSSGLGTGVSNTTAMMTSSSSAAKYCRDMGSDWYLASRDEMSLIYRNKDLLGPSYVLDPNTYWTSTENSSSLSWVVRFSDGYASITNKARGLRARCVRNI